MSGERKEPIPAKRTNQANGKNDPKPAKKAKVLEEAEESSDEDFAPNVDESSSEEPPLLSDEGEHGEDEDFDLEGYMKFRNKNLGQQEGSSESGEEESEEGASGESEGEEEPESDAEESEEYEDSSSEEEKPKKSNGKK